MVGIEKWEQLKSEHAKGSIEKIKGRVSDYCKEMDGQIDYCSQRVDDIQVPKGVPHVEILKTAKNIEADIIILGTHGQNIFQDSLLGTTARRIVKDSKIPVLVIRLPERDQ